MMTRRYGLVFCGLMTLSTAASAQRDFDDVEIKTTHVAGKVYMLEGSGGNIGVSVGADGVLIIDDQFAPLADRIRDALGKLGDSKPKFVLNTHWHGDHVGGNEEFGRDGTIIAHTNVRKRLSTKQELFGRTVEPRPKVALPVITFDESLSIHFNDEEIRAVHCPHAHTDGDIAIFFGDSNVVHMGDLFFNGMFPFVDLGHGGSVSGMIDGVKRILGQLPPDAKIIPGHGPLADVDDLKTYLEMLTQTSETVKAGIQAGKSVDEIKSARLPERWASWGSGFIPTDRWIDTLYADLSK